MNPPRYFCAIVCALSILFTIPAHAAEFVMSSSAEGFRVALPAPWASLPRDESGVMAMAAMSGVVPQEHRTAVAKLSKGARKKRLPAENTAFFVVISAPYSQTVISKEDRETIQSSPDAALTEILRGMRSVAKSHPGAAITADNQDGRRALLCYSAATAAGVADKTDNVCISMRPAKTRFFIMMAHYGGRWDTALQDEIVGVMERAQLADPGSAKRKAARPAKRRK